MIGRRKSPDGMPFRLYERVGKFKVSYGYKLPDGKWAFRLTAATNDKEACARIRTEAIERANELNGVQVESGETAALFRRYFAWQRALPRDSEERKADSTLDENEFNEAPRLLREFGKMKPATIKPVHNLQVPGRPCHAGSAGEGEQGNRAAIGGAGIRPP